MQRSVFRYTGDIVSYEVITYRSENDEQRIVSRETLEDRSEAEWCAYEEALKRQRLEHSAVVNVVENGSACTLSLGALADTIVALGDLDSVVDDELRALIVFQEPPRTHMVELPGFELELTDSEVLSLREQLAAIEV